MKKLLLLFLAGIMSSTATIVAQSNQFPFIQIGTTYPSPTLAYVHGTGEQMSGQQFQNDAILTYKGYQYTVYWNITKDVCISRRKLPTGAWEELVLPYKYGTKADDNHNVIVMGICPNDGSIHLSYDHHNHPLRYCYSIQGSANEPENMPWEASSFSATTNVMDEAVPDVTYPRFIVKPDGNLLFECRFHYSGYGDSYLREYDAVTKKWTLIGRYVQGMDVTSSNPIKVNNNILYSDDACAYINGMTYDKNGKLHVTWCWRDDFGGQTNHDFYYAYSDDDGRTWKNTYNVEVAETQHMTPVVDRESGGCLSQHMREVIMVEEIVKNRGYINQESQDVDSKGGIYALNSHIPDGEGTDGNWSSSRNKARLHLRFRNNDGSWTTKLVTCNGENIWSRSRAHIAFDSFDNAYIVANGAGVFTASSADNYTNWTKISEDGKDGYYSEPLVDKPLLKEQGILSFVYLGADKKLTVFDYLLDNPNTPNGSGLKGEYFSDNNFTASISTEENALVSNTTLPTNTQSVRWSGTFETSYGENYTLHLNTAKSANVYIDGKLVKSIKENTNATENNITFDAIASHKHDITIEVQMTSSDEISLSWSSERTNKELIPTTALYSDMQGITPTPIEEPDLKGRIDLTTTLQGEKTITAGSGKDIITLPFNPIGDYTLEVKALVENVDGRGMDIQARAASSKGLRVSMDETITSWMAPFSNPLALSNSDNTTEQLLRFAVSGEDVYIYQNNKIISQKKTTPIGDLDGADEVYREPFTVEELGSNNLIKNPTFSGIANNGAPGGAWVSDGTMGGGTNPRVQVGNSIVPITISASQTAFTIRFDYNMAKYFSYPILLKPNTWYEHTVDVITWGEASRANSPVDVIFSTSADGLKGVVFKETMYTPGVINTGEKKVFYFKTADDTSDKTYYLTYRNTTSTSLVGITNLTLAARESNASLIIGKNYEGGSAKIEIIYVKYDDGAFAPKKGDDTKIEDLKNKDSNIQVYNRDGIVTINSENEMLNVSIYDIMGRCKLNEKIQNNDFSARLQPGAYIIKIKTTAGVVAAKVIAN